MCSESANKDDYTRTSTVDTLDDPIPELFDIFTGEPDEQKRWTTYTYSAHFDLLGFTNKELDMEQLEIGELTWLYVDTCISFICLYVPMCRWTTFIYSAHFDLHGFKNCVNKELDTEQLEIGEYSSVLLTYVSICLYL